MKKNLRIFSIALAMLGLMFGFQNCSTQTPTTGGTLSSTDEIEDQVDSSSDPVDTVVIPPDDDTVVDDGDGSNGEITTRLEGFQAQCADTSGVYNVDGDVKLCTYTYPVLQSSGDIARMIWAHCPPESSGCSGVNSYEPSGRDFDFNTHAELTCKQIMGANTVFPYGAIRMIAGQPGSEYWDFHNGGWEKVQSPDDDSNLYLLLKEVSCRFYNQDEFVGTNHITFN
tara:strand:- start:85145 stop:85822 length:678 start_codon:yes stop_codon:yes gene_type:complete